MFTTHGHQIPNTTVQDRSPGHSVTNCGGVEVCKTCKNESDIVQGQIKQLAEVSGVAFPLVQEDRPEMLSEGGFIEKAKRLVWEQFYPHAIHLEMGFSVKDVYVVWFTKTLQNWKAVLSTNVKDDMIYEVTYNGDKAEAYVDQYHKVQNIRVPD